LNKNKKCVIDLDFNKIGVKISEEGYKLFNRLLFVA